MLDPESCDYKYDRKRQESGCMSREFVLSESHVKFSLGNDEDKPHTE